MAQSKTQKPQFFKIILENTMHEKKLWIPRKFVKEYGSDLPEWVTIEVPDGSQWQIKLTKTEDGKVCMQQGWSDFAKHYSLSFGNLLLFNPNGESLSKFHVVIFDMSSTEINYDSPLPSHKRKMANNTNTCESGSSKGTECGMMRQKKAKIGADLSFPSHDQFKAEDLSRIPRYQPNDVGDGRCSKSMQKKAELSMKTREFECRNPYFEKIIQPYAVYRKNGNSTLNVPANFAREYLINKIGDVIIQHKNGRTWLVSCQCSRSEKRSYSLIRFGGGWNKFAKDNNLRVGDACVFEMINCRNITFKVTISRKSKGCKFTAETIQTKEGDDDDDVVVLEEPCTAKNGKPSCSSADARRQTDKTPKGNQHCWKAKQDNHILLLR